MSVRSGGGCSLHEHDLIASWRTSRLRAVALGQECVHGHNTAGEALLLHDALGGRDRVVLPMPRQGPCDHHTLSLCPLVTLIAAGLTEVHYAITVLPIVRMLRAAGRPQEMYGIRPLLWEDVSP
jgi:hypothetical protein